ncbi:histone-lysine N-methyltransferase 2D [Gadus morhua]|uniref:DBF4-type domain-containing protein n=1 Tax=Gadus morhua TaxID=8049 RepID=A0A8C4Z813_GADMO|nr:histone-lysine N-methyltransferase 2D-like [Gadus morhua]
MGGGLLGVLPPGEKRLTGKSFFLDNVKRRAAALLVEAIFHLGGKVEGFLHKDVTYLVTGSQEASPEERIQPAKTEAKGGRGETDPPRDGVREAKDRPWPTTPLPARPTCFGSRGMALLEKAIRNNERLQGSVLQKARSWGVQILYVDDILLYLQRLTRESFNTKQKKAELKNCSKVAVRVVKAAGLKCPYLKVEDLSRKYQPLYVQSLSFPSFCFSGRFGPSEPPPPAPCPEKGPEQECDTKESHKVASGPLGPPEPPLPLKPSPWRALNKVQGYCECCREAFTNQEEHLVSATHRGFLQQASNYSALDRLVASLLPGFDPNPPQHIDPSLDSVPTPACGPSPGAADLLTLSDGAAEKAVRALLNPVAAFDEAFRSLPAKPPSPPPAAPRPVPSHHASHPTCAPILAALLAAPRPPSPCMGLRPLDPPTLTPCSPLRQPPKLEPLSPCKPTPDGTSSDPYSQPPVLSPQAPDTRYERLDLFSDPPELSPEIPILPLPALQGMQVSGSETNHSLFNVLEKIGALCPETSPPSALCRSSSFPLMASTSSNSKKRSRSASPRRKSTKRRRLAFSVDQQSFCKPEGDLSVGLPGPVHLGPVCSSTDLAVAEACMGSDPPGDLGLGEPLHLKPLLWDSPSCGPVPPEGVKEATKPTFTSFLVPHTKVFSQPPSRLASSHSGLGDQPPSPVSPNTPDCSFSIQTPPGSHHTQSSQCSLPHAVSSVCIESALVPDVAGLSPSSSESDWDHEFLSRLAPTGAPPQEPLLSSRGRCRLDQELLQRACTWAHNSSYEARLHSALQPPTSRVL